MKEKVNYFKTYICSIHFWENLLYFDNLKKRIINKTLVYEDLYPPSYDFIS